MAEASPIKPSDLGPITDGLLACDHLKELMNTRVKMQTFLQWLLANDATGNLGDDFKLAIRNQLLFDLLKKGWFVRANPTTGYLELVEFIPLESLDGSGSTEGDTLVFEGGVWITKSAPSIFLAPTSGGATVPAVTAGGVLTVAHGLGVEPQSYAAHLICNAADLNYAIGDRVDALSLMFLNSATPEVLPAVTVFANATQVGVVFRDGGAGDSYQLHNKSTFARESIDVAKWDVKLYAHV